MTLISLLINTAVFFFVLNISYIRNKRSDPDCPAKPFSQLVLFPLALGVVFTLIVDQFRGLMIYQLLFFLLASLLLYFIFYGMGNRKR